MRREHTQDVVAAMEQSQVTPAVISGDPLDLVVAHLPGSVVRDLVDQLPDGSYERLAVVDVEFTVPELAGDEGDDASPPQELYQDLTSSVHLNLAFGLLVTLASIVDAVGLLTNDPTVIVGAMVFAPLLTPVMGISFGVVMADARMLTSAILVEVVGLLLAVATGVVSALLLPGHHLPLTHQLLIRAHPGFTALILALAAGAAGAISFTSDLSTALVGVAVAVALDPPAVAAGLGFGAGQWSIAWGSLLLLGVNVIAIVLAGVATFNWRGIHPRAWFERESAEHATRRSLVISGLLMALLVGPLGHVSYLNWQERQLGSAVRRGLEATLPSNVRVEKLSVDASTEPVTVQLTIAGNNREVAWPQLRQRLQQDLKTGRAILLKVTFIPEQHFQVTSPNSHP